MHLTVEDILKFPAHIQQQIQEKIYADYNRTANKTSKLEQGTRNESLAKEKTSGLATQVNGVCHITVTSYRKRLLDCDNICSKYAIDGLVLSGLLQDDKPENIEEIRHRQIKSKEEKTVIEIVEA